MFAEKPSYNASSPSKLHLPSINQSLRRRSRVSPTPSVSSMGANTSQLTDNISELKAKYSDYATWLKRSSRYSRGSGLTHELLKDSLCHMGIDIVKAEQVASTCSWYVYQFEKDLKLHTKQKDPSLTMKTKKQNSHKYKSKKLPMKKSRDEDSTVTINSLEKDDSLPSNSHSFMRQNQFVLPSIHVSDASTSSRFRHVDFNQKQPNLSPTPSYWRSAIVKTRVISKLQPLSRKTPDTDSPTDMNSTFFRQNLNTGFARSILRKQTSISSAASTDIGGRKLFSRIVTPSSTVLEDIPLGTRSKLLFGGSDCFAQIMNELEKEKT